MEPGRDIPKINAEPWPSNMCAENVGKNVPLRVIFKDTEEQSMKEYSKIMFASINHELRTPINAILNSLNCMSDKICPTVAQYLDICQSSGQFLLSLVNDTLDFAQL